MVVFVLHAILLIEAECVNSNLIWKVKSCYIASVDGYLSSCFDSLGVSISIVGVVEIYEFCWDIPISRIYRVVQTEGYIETLIEQTKRRLWV